MKPKIFFYIASQDGVAYYRLHKPAMKLKELGLADVLVSPYHPTRKLKNTWNDFRPDDDGNSPATTSLTRELNKFQPDAIIMQREDTGVRFSTALALRYHYKCPIIQDNDDYIFDVPYTNPGSISYKDKRLHDIGVEDPKSIHQISLGAFDGYTVTTPHLEQYYGNYSPTYLCPNSIDFKNKKFIKKKKHEDFRIMFSSSATHYENLYMISGVIDEFMTKHKDATFYMYGKLPNLFQDKPYKNRIKKMRWIRPENYSEYIAKFSPDVCLAPLTDRNFNRAKSNLRILEYWSSGYHAVIASRVGHYIDTIKDGWNGYLVMEKEEWLDKLEYLYKHRDKIEKLGKNGHDTAKKEYNLEKNARNWLNAVNAVIKDYDPDRKPPEQYTIGSR